MYEVSLRLVIRSALLVGTLDEPVPVSDGVVAFAGLEKLRLADAVVLTVTGALCVWITWVPFFVQVVVYVVNEVTLKLGALPLLVGMPDEPVPVVDGVVAFALIEKPRLAVGVTFAEFVGAALRFVDVKLPVTGAEWVCTTDVPFSTQVVV